MSAGESFYVMEGRIRNPASFLHSIPSTIRELGAILRLDAGVINYTLPSLDSIQRALPPLSDSEPIYANAVFLGITVYFGEMIRMRKPAQWVLRHPAERVWEPWLVTKRNQQVAPFMVVYEEVYDKPEIGSLHGAAVGLLASLH